MFYESLLHLASPGNNVMVKKLLIQAMIVLMVAQNVYCRSCAFVINSTKTICEHQGTGIYIVYLTDTECHVCCLCKAGFRKNQDCIYGDAKTTDCRACEFDPEDSNNQTYTPTENNSTHCFISQNETLCLGLQNTQYVPGSPTQPSRCECKLGFYSDVDIMKHGCNEHSPCDKGYQPVLLGTKTSNTRCGACPDGTFSNVSSPTSKCVAFSKCTPGQIITMKGTSKSDVVCSDRNSTLPKNQTTHSDAPSTVAQDQSNTSSMTTAIHIQTDSAPVELSAAVKFGIVGTVLLVLLLIIACVCCRKEGRRREHRNPSPEGGRGSGLPPENASCSRDEDVQSTDEEHGALLDQSLSSDSEYQNIKIPERTVPGIKSVKKKVEIFLRRSMSEPGYGTGCNMAEYQPHAKYHIEQEIRPPHKPNFTAAEHQTHGTEVETQNLRNMEHRNAAIRSESVEKTTSSGSLDETSTVNDHSSESGSEVRNREVENSCPTSPSQPKRHTPEQMHSEEEDDGQRHTEAPCSTHNAEEGELIFEKKLPQNNSRNNQIGQSRSIPTASTENACCNQSDHDDDLKLFEYEKDKAIVAEFQADHLRDALMSKKCRYEMLYGANGLQEKVTTTLLKKFLRQNMLIEEIGIVDLETVYYKDQNELRAQMLKKVEETQGNKLSPRFLLLKSSKFSERDIYDKLCKVFISHMQEGNN